MRQAWTVRARPLGAFAALVMIVFTLGVVAGPASADPPSDRGGAGNSADAHAKNAERKSRSGSDGGATSDTSGGGVSTAASTRSSGKPGKARGHVHKTTTASAHTSSGTAGTSGDASSPQPESTADKNHRGANAGTCHDDNEEPGGPYCSTRNGSASKNGNNNGGAKGRPCAGCVGKADNKQPPGQVAEFNKHGKLRGVANKGYECDDNNGIGKGNPAHTGCKPTTPPPPECPKDECPPPPECPKDECPPPPECPKDECPPPPTCPDGSDLPCDKDEDCVPSEANDFCDEGTPPAGDDDDRPTVIGGVEDFANPRPPAVAGVEAFAGPQPTAGLLPATGAVAVSGLVTLGFGLLLTGAAMIGLRRRVAPSTS